MLAFNWTDFAILITLAMGLTIGYFQGLARQVIMLAALYLGAILGTQYAYAFGAWLKNLFQTTPGMLLNAIAFLVIVGLVALILSLLSQDVTRMTFHMPAWIDRLGGMFVGLVAAWIVVTLTVNVLTFATGVTSWGEAESTRKFLASGILASRFAGATSASFPTLIGAIRPWLPAGLPSIFDL